MIQIYGAGVAGTYLYHLLTLNGFSVAIYDKRREPDCRCAWGIVYREAKELYSKIGIKFDEYVLLKPKFVIANGLKLKNKDIVIFDKKKLLSDLWPDFGFLENPEIIIDATGVARAYLPKISEDRTLPTFQTMERHEVEENIYIEAEKTGYAWAFPLGNNLWHIGAGNIDKERIPKIIERLREKYGFGNEEFKCSCSAKVRMLPPSKCKPFICGRVVGVGEAIGCVSGAGEGNAPALLSAKILAECIMSGELEKYEERILTELDWIEKEQRFIEAMLNSNYLTALKLLPKIIAFENKRAVEHSIFDIRKLVRI